MKIMERRWWLRGLVFLIISALLTPLSLPAAYAGAQPPRPTTKPGMSTKKKLVLLAGAGLLYFLYKKHQATRARTAVNGGTPSTNVRQPQLYRSKNGGIYYRDTQGKPVWLTVPQQRVELPLEEVRRYAPDYNRYRGAAPAAPRGYRTESFSDFNGGLLPGPNGN